MKLFYYNGKIENSVVIQDDQFLHITKVLRLVVNDKIVIFNGDGNFYHCQIGKIEKKYLVADVLSVEQCENKTKNQITLFQGIVKKPDNQALIVQKMTELGLDKVVFFQSDYTNVKLETVKNSRLDKIVVESCKQCGRAKLLQVENCNKFDTMIEKLKQYDLVIFAYENQQKISLTSALKVCSGLKIALVVGSEGGFSLEEVNKLESVNAKVVGLGKTILRAETASIALASCVLCLTGEWQ